MSYCDPSGVPPDSDDRPPASAPPPPCWLCAIPLTLSRTLYGRLVMPPPPESGTLGMSGPPGRGDVCCAGCAGEGAEAVGVGVAGAVPVFGAGVCPVTVDVAEAGAGVIACWFACFATDPNTMTIPAMTAMTTAMPTPSSSGFGPPAALRGASGFFGVAGFVAPRAHLGHWVVNESITYPHFGHSIIRLFPLHIQRMQS